MQNLAVVNGIHYSASQHGALCNYINASYSYLLAVECKRILARIFCKHDFGLRKTDYHNFPIHPRTLKMFGGG